MPVRTAPAARGGPIHEAMQIHEPTLALTLSADFVSSPGFELLSNVTLAAAAAWLAASAFESWRRRSANLTPVASAEVNVDARPGFLDVDHDARGAAVARGDAYAAKLTKREAEAARRAAESAVSGTTPGGRLAGLAAAAMSVFTLASMVFGACTQIAWMGRYAEDLSAPGRLLSIVRAHPWATAAAAFVVLFHVHRYVRNRRWSGRS